MSIIYKGVEVGVTLGIGGGGNALVGFDTPDASLGSDGQYYFKLNKGGWVFTGTFGGNANTGIAGWEMIANDAVKVVGLRGYTRSTYSGKLRFGDLSTVLVEKNVDFVANSWVSVMLDTSITLTAGTHYIVQLVGNSGTLRYTSNKPFSTNKISYVQARYGSYPGSTEAYNLYSADIMIETNPPYAIDTEYYKSSGSWSAVT